MHPKTIFHYLFGAIATLVLAPFVILFSIIGFPGAAYRPVRIWAFLLHLVTGVRTRAHGLENIPATGPYVVVSNHCSHLDGPAIVRALPHPLYIVIKQELARIPLFGHALVSLGCIAVDRSDSESARAEMARAVNSLCSGRRILVFAEGTRSRDGQLARLKKGGFHLAVDAQVPIVPLAVNGSHTLFAKGAPAVNPGVVDVHVCRPIPTASLSARHVDELILETREAMLEARRLDPDFRDAGMDDASPLKRRPRSSEPLHAQ